MGRKRKTRGPRRSLLDDMALFRRACSAEGLREGWRRVWRNGGAAGGDHVTVQRFASRAAMELARLRAELASGDYRPGPLREVDIPKKGGGVRTLRIPCVRDRVVQTAVAQVLSVRLEEEFEEASFGYRPGRSVAQAVAAVAAARRAGFEWVVDADIEDYFDSVPHDKLMERWRESVSGGPLTALLELWLAHWFPTGRGLAQGSPLSPLLANLYLDRLDEALSGRGMRLVRYADDFVVLCRSRGGAQQALEKVRAALARHGLRLNMRKTRIVSFAAGLRFLGHVFVHSLVMKSAHGDGEAADDALARWMRRIADDDASAEAERQARAAEEARREAAGLSTAFRTLYVMREGRRLNVRNKAFTVEERVLLPDGGEEWRELLIVPAAAVDRIEIGPRCAVETGARQAALALETPIAFVNGHGETLGWIAPEMAPMAGRHMAQAALLCDEQARLALARRFVAGRVRNQRALLRRLLRGRKAGSQTKDALARMGRIIRRVEHAESVAEVMGLEGRAAALYWPALGRLMGGGFRLKTRQRPARDAANIMLNMLASLLERDITVAVARAGLHPGFGALHEAGNHRNACVYDLMEEFRAHLAEGLVVWCVNKGVVKHGMFQPFGDGGGVRMSAVAAEALIRAYEARAARLVKSPRGGRRVSWKRLMQEQAMALAAHYEGRGQYAPYLMDY